MEVLRSALDALVAHARGTLPDECCGLLVGTAARIEEAVPARNVRASPFRYQIDPADHFALIRRVRRERRAIVGGYHSHPAGPSSPSATDLAEAHDPEWLHLIVSLADDAGAEVRGYRISNSSVLEVPLETVEG